MECPSINLDPRCCCGFKKNQCFYTQIGECPPTGIKASITFRPQDARIELITKYGNWQQVFLLGVVPTSILKPYIEFRFKAEYYN